jgi:hypothetical protein
VATAASCAFVSRNVALAQPSGSPPEQDAEIPVEAGPPGGQAAQPGTDTAPSSAAASAETRSADPAPAAASAGAAKQAPAPSPTPAPAARPTSPSTPTRTGDVPSRTAQREPTESALDISGYAQLQYETHQDSEDQLRQGGVLLNQDRFLVRRARLKLVREWAYAALLLEFDGNTKSGPSARLQKAEGSLVWGRSTEKDQPPRVSLTLGLFDLPFGRELWESSKARWFMERSLASRAFFPGEPDVGARLAGGVSFFRYQIALTNGEPTDEKSGLALQDPNKNKDITVRVGADAGPRESLRVSGGVSFNRGRGFHAGTDATKGLVAWNDRNEDGDVDDGELYGQPASTATPSRTFRRWAVGGDLALRLKTRIGWLDVTGEVTAASNLDRGLFIADPTLTNTNVRELGYYAAITQEVSPYGVVGFRFDTYDPNADFLEARAGKLLPRTQTIHTYSPLVGLVLPDRARLLLEWDIVRDYLARDSRGVPTDLNNDVWTLRLQVNL